MDSVTTQDAARHALLELFERTASKNSAHLCDLDKELSFRLNDKGWCFTLTSLYHFLRDRDERFRDLDYKSFRKLVYASPINSTLAAHHAEVRIADRRSNIDKSVYQLVWLE